MQIEKIKLGEGISLPVKFMQAMNVASGEELTIVVIETPPNPRLEPTRAYRRSVVSAIVSGCG